jgi:hypothetical protein
VRYIGRLRADTAAQTDERVRLTGEMVGGVLATKMLGECLSSPSRWLWVMADSVGRAVEASERAEPQPRVADCPSPPTPLARLGGPLFGADRPHPPPGGLSYPAHGG